LSIQGDRAYAVSLADLNLVPSDKLDEDMNDFDLLIRSFLLTQ